MKNQFDFKLFTCSQLITCSNHCSKSHADSIYWKKFRVEIKLSLILRYLNGYLPNDLPITVSKIGYYNYFDA